MQRYFSDKKNNDSFILKQDDWYHIKTVMRMHDGDKIEIVYDTKLYICEIDDGQARIVTCQDECIKNQYYVLLLPLLQEQKMSFVLQKATELGIDEIIPILTSRSKVKIDEKEDKKILRWQRICKEASEQSKRLTIPLINHITSIDDLNVDGFKMVCSTREKNNTLKKVLKNNLKCDKIVMCVGPEGGLTSEEEDKLIGKGFIPTILGNNIMRVETAPIYLLSILNYELME